MNITNRKTILLKNCAGPIIGSIAKLPTDTALTWIAEKHRWATPAVLEKYENNTNSVSFESKFVYIYNKSKSPS